MFALFIFILKFWQNFTLEFLLSARFLLDNCNKMKNLCNKVIGSKMKNKEAMGGSDELPADMLVTSLTHDDLVVWRLVLISIVCLNVDVIFFLFGLNLSTIYIFGWVSWSNKFMSG